MITYLLGFLLFFTSLTLVGFGQDEESAPPELAGKRILVLGDSITASGSYVSFLEYFYQKHAPEDAPDMISVGLSSETASGLSENDHPFPRPCIHTRLERALAVVKPDVVFACYGMNDGIYHPPTPKILAAYQTGINKLVARNKAAGAETVILTPPPYDALARPDRLAKPDAIDWSYKAPHSDYPKVLQAFSAWVMEAKPGAFQIDVNLPFQAAIDAARALDPPVVLVGDGIHPGVDGHLVLARIIWTALGHPADDTSIKSIKADPLFKLVDERRKKRTRGWLEHIGYTRGKVVGPNPLGETEATAAEFSGMIEAFRSRR